MELDEMDQRRQANWGQTAATATPNPESAARLVERVGVATLYPVASELPNLFWSYSGAPDVKVDSNWDSPSGEVYSWRWKLGRAEAAFYTAIVKGRPTWVSWAMLPAILRLRGELREIEEVYQAGEISRGAYRIYKALHEAGGVLNTGALRRAAGFPTGKEQRAAYLKAIAELDTRLLLAKVFAADGDDMSHALVSGRHPKSVAAAQELTREAALDQFLKVYLPSAVYAVPVALAKQLGLPEKELQAALIRLGEQVQAVSLTGQTKPIYVWQS